jgi:hypothetical protein
MDEREEHGERVSTPGLELRFAREAQAAVWPAALPTGHLYAVGTTPTVDRSPVRFAGAMHYGDEAPSRPG